MAVSRPFMFLLLCLGLSSLFPVPITAEEQYFQWTDDNGKSQWLADSRKPALYTAEFGDCMGGSLVNVSRFDAAYYKDNMTVLFHLAGETSLKNEALMMYIGVYAYGSNRFDLTFNPCSANIDSLCPMKAGIPIEANGVIPISPSDVANIPSIAVSIPDFEGEAILRIFANSTQSQIGCFSAVVTNGVTFAQPATVGSILGVFTIVAVISSFATAIYGDSIPVMRKHYAHSLSVLVVFAVFHHIYYTGALSMNWPSVLVAFWSNYAWAGGMVYNQGMQNAINKFVGNNRGNTSFIGAAGVGSNDNNVVHNYDIRKIYSRGMDGVSVSGLMWRAKYNKVALRVEKMIAKRTLANSTDGYSWYGGPVGAGLPLPGNFSGFAGTLGQEKIPVSNAFMTGLFWLLILIGIVGGSVVLFKFVVEGLSRSKLIKQDRLAFFRSHWLGYTGFAVLRTLYIAFFMMIFLTTFQFTYGGSTGMIAVAGAVFGLFFLGMIGISIYACVYRIKHGHYSVRSDRINMERRWVFGCLPWYRFSRASRNLNANEKAYVGSFPFWRIGPPEPESRNSVHDDEDFTKKFGWLASRFRQDRWWFFSLWLIYEVARAGFFAGASGHPLIQVFGLLAVETVAFITIIILKPFEGQRLNALLVYCLGFSKVTTVALSCAFDVRFNLPRIPTTVVGVVIIVIQAILTIILLIAIIVGAISSYMSVMRNREDFRPRKWTNLRSRYFKHLEEAGTDARSKPLAPLPDEPVLPEEPKGPYFNVSAVRRLAKIEDEDADFVAEIHDPRSSLISINSPSGRQSPANIRTSSKPSRAISTHSNLSSSNLPFGARVHRASWSSREIAELTQKRMSGLNEAQRTSGNLSLTTRFMTSQGSLSRIPSPFASRPQSPIEESNSTHQSSRPESRNVVEALSPLSSNLSSMSPGSTRPPLATLPSEEYVETLRDSDKKSTSSPAL